MSATATLDTLPQVDRTLAEVRDLGIAMLIDLAQQGEIDPWDVQVIDAIDRHLKHLLQATTSQEAEANLSQSGQAFVWAAMLVLLKAHTLERNAENEEEISWEEELLDNNDSRLTRLPLNLEDCLKRRHTAQPFVQRPITLDDVIQQLHQIASTLANKPTRRASERGKQLSARAAAQTIVGLAHEENLTEMAGELDKFITNNNETWRIAREWINLEHLVDIWNSKNDYRHESSNSNVVGVFWALLLLSAQSKVELSQQEFYQEIRIRAI